MKRHYNNRANWMANANRAQQESERISRELSEQPLPTARINYIGEIRIGQRFRRYNAMGAFDTEVKVSGIEFNKVFSIDMLSGEEGWEREEIFRMRCQPTAKI